MSNKQSRLEVRINAMPVPVEMALKVSAVKQCTRRVWTQQSSASPLYHSVQPRT